jgi:hypothetical protein
LRVKLRQKAEFPFEITAGGLQIAILAVMHEEEMVDAGRLIRLIWRHVNRKPGGLPARGITASDAVPVCARHSATIPARRRGQRPVSTSRAGSP